MKKCQHCEKEFEDDFSRNFSNHVKWCSKNPKREEYLDHLKKLRLDRTYKSMVRDGRIYVKQLKESGPLCCLNCKEEIKNRRSFASHLMYEKGNHPGWDHINKSTDHRSYPEKYFLAVLKEKGLFEQHVIIEKMTFGKYYLDFAFLDLRIDLEIDGGQHYNTTEAIEYDNMRNKFVLDAGWRVYRISWEAFLKDKTGEISRFLSFIESSEKIVNYDHDFYYQKFLKNKESKMTIFVNY